VKIAAAKDLRGVRTLAFIKRPACLEVLSSHRGLRMKDFFAQLAVPILAGLSIFPTPSVRAVSSVGSSTAASCFSATGPMTAPRSGHTGTLLPNGKVLVAGGNYQFPAELFDPSTNAFTLLPPGAISGRSSHTATLLPDGKVLIAGGNGPSVTLNTAEIFDPATQSLTPISPSPMISPRYGHSATLLPTGKVLICGGQASFLGVSNTAELFDPASGSFAAVGYNMSCPRYLHTATLLSDGRVLIAGGTSGSGPGGSIYTNAADIFDPTTESFIAVAEGMRSPRSSHTATLLPSGKVLVAGGWNGTATVSSAEIFDPVTLRFAVVANAMTAPRILHTATLLVSGKVFVAGGDDATRATVNTAELFDPALGTFTSLSPSVMTSPRRLQTATLLPNGSVLLAGGVTEHTPISTAELFDLPPTITNVPADISAAIVTFSAPAAIDSSGHDAPVNCTPSSGAMFLLGTTAVTCTATDTQSAAATATFKIIVTDTVPPVITVPSDITVAKQKQPKHHAQGATVSFAVSAADIVDGSVAATANPTSGSFFKLGTTTTVNVVAIDVHGNRSTRRFTIAVVNKIQRPR
jgi:WD40 repeat protein